MNEIFEWVLGLNMLKGNELSNDWTNNWLNSLNDFRVLICLKEKNELFILYTNDRLRLYNFEIVFKISNNLLVSHNC